MKDRFKFRVWSKECSEYIEQECLDCYITYAGELICYNLEDTDDDCIYGGYPKDDAIIEQSTGLKDKNGKLIYEGDILKPLSNSIKKQVIYDDGCFWAKDVIYFHDACHIYKRWIDECGYEIIGNIHENPELLKEKE